MERESDNKEQYTPNGKCNQEINIAIHKHDNYMILTRMYSEMNLIYRNIIYEVIR